MCCLCSDLPSRSYDCLKVCLQAPTITLFFHALCIANTILILSLAGALARIFSLNLRTYVCTYVRRFCYLHTFLVFGVVPLMSVRLLWLFIFFFFFFFALRGTITSASSVPTARSFAGTSPSPSGLLDPSCSTVRRSSFPWPPRRRVCRGEDGSGGGFRLRIGLGYVATCAVAPAV